MRLFIILHGYLLILLTSHVESLFLKKALFGWNPPSYPGYPYPGYAPPPPQPGFGGLLGTLFGKFLSAKYGAPPPYPYPGYPPPFPGPFPPSFGFPPAFPAAIPIPVNVPVPVPVDRPYPVPFGKPSILPPITIVKHISQPSKMNGENTHESMNPHPFHKLFQMSPPKKSSSSWSSMHDNYNSYSNHKEGWN